MRYHKISTNRKIRKGLVINGLVSKGFEVIKTSSDLRKIILLKNNKFYYVVNWGRSFLRNSFYKNGKQKEMIFLTLTVKRELK